MGTTPANSTIVCNSFQELIVDVAVRFYIGISSIELALQWYPTIMYWLTQLERSWKRLVR